MTTKNQIITHEGTQISASGSAWTALGFQVYSDGTLNCGPSGVDAFLYFGIQAAGGKRDESAVIAAIVERDRRAEERTRVSAEGRLADSIGKLASEIGAESAASFVQRLPDRIRPYAEKVLSGR